MNTNLYDIITKTIGGKTVRDYPLRRLTTFRIGGPADLVASPANDDELCAVMKIIFENDLPFIPLGAGSNILFSDDGFRGVAISLGQMKQIDIIEDNKTEIKLKTSAGASLAGTIRRFAKFSALGVSRMWGIPGQIGGSIACNAGAFDFNLSDLICEIELLDKKCKKIVSKIRDLDYGYRNMQLPPGAIVTSAILRAHKGDPLEIERELDIAKQKRRHSQPRGVASAGCIFRNPSPENPAGAIIDRLGFKGMRIGSAEVSNKHANFIVNHGKARACDVLELIDRIRHRALDEEGINLELEIRLAGHGV